MGKSARYELASLIYLPYIGPVTSNVGRPYSYCTSYCTSKIHLIRINTLFDDIVVVFFYPIRYAIPYKIRQYHALSLQMLSCYCTSYCTSYCTRIVHTAILYFVNRFEHRIKGDVGIDFRDVVRFVSDNRLDDSVIYSCFSHH